MAYEAEVADHRRGSPANGHDCEDRVALKVSFTIALTIEVTLSLIAKAAQPKHFKAQRQEGAFGRIETVAPAAEATRDVDYWVPSARAAVEKPGGEAAPGAELKRKTTIHDALTAVVEQYEEEDSQPGSYESPLVVGAKGTAAIECDSPQCGKLKEWLEEVVASQADPCRERNTFLCNASLTLPSWDATTGKSTLHERTPRTFISASASEEGAITEDHSSKEKNGLSEISKACLRYAWNPEEGVEGILAFLSHFKLDLRNMAEDTTEDPLERMIELSLGYGLDVLVSFSLDYNVTGDIFHAFDVQINANSELEEFFWSVGSLNEEAVDDFYQLLLRRYALVEDSEIVQHLQEADADISDILNVTTESGTRAKTSIAELAKATGVTTGRWRELLGGYCPTQSTCNDYVVTNERALALVAYVAQAGGGLRMRRLLAWHVLRYLVGPKADVLAVLNHTGLESDLQEDYDVAVSLRMDAVSTQSIVSVANFMVHFQNAVASVFKSPLNNRSGGATRNVTKQHDGVIPVGNAREHLDSGRGDPFAAFTGIEKHNGDTNDQQLALKGSSFPLLWLRRLRAWHALPPLLQALLPVMASLVHIKRPNDFFRLPYYDIRALAAYNFAALGHVVARAMARKLDEPRRNDKSKGERWQRFLDRTEIIDSSVTYCAEATRNEARMTFTYLI
ncbi:hypothetical protein HPB49_012789 [Dermacentor silvarum]|uniref:Uncharacterized protein n=1 Tax=Dermacentor silvarum TaxID=543639 RepID=A0ACB8CRH1_DERSI|nr:hypothetical protein HPB49_012789 [Dermacentor silvarum]